MEGLSNKKCKFFVFWQPDVKRPSLKIEYQRQDFIFETHFFIHFTITTSNIDVINAQVKNIITE